MKRRRKDPDGQIGINMTPMLSLAFLLLLFFVAAAPFMKERGIKFFMYPRHWGDCSSITIAVDGQNRIIVRDGDRPRQVGIRSIRKFVARRLAETQAFKVVVQAHRESDMGVVIRIADEAGKARANPPVYVSIHVTDH